MVLVCHSREFIFLKTRKTAGTSVEMLLEPYCAPPGHVVRESTTAVVSPQGIVGRRLTRGKREGFWRTDWRNHMEARRVAVALGADVWRRYKKITVVREPFDRLVSLFFWRRGKETADLDPEDRIRSFREFARDDWPTDSDVLFDQNGFVPNHVLRFENLADDLRDLAKAFDLDLDPTSLPHAKNHRSRRGGLSVEDCYDAATVEIVHERMPWAFDGLGYPREPSSEVVIGRVDHERASRNGPSTLFRPRIVDYLRRWNPASLRPSAART